MEIMYSKITKRPVKVKKFLFLKNGKVLCRRFVGVNPDLYLLAKEKEIFCWEKEQNKFGFICEYKGNYYVNEKGNPVFNLTIRNPEHSLQYYRLNYKDKKTQENLNAILNGAVKYKKILEDDLILHLFIIKELQK